jgi:hypothetical protein
MLLNFSAAFEGFKRAMLQDGFLLLMGGWGDLGNKLNIISAYGKQMALQIPQGTMGPNDELPPYQGRQTTRKIREDCEQMLAGKGLAPRRMASEISKKDESSATSSKNILNNPVLPNRQLVPSSPILSATSSSYQQAALPNFQSLPHASYSQVPTIPGGLPPSTLPTMPYMPHAPPAHSLPNPSASYVGYSEYYTLPGSSSSTVQHASLPGEL